MIDDFEFRRWRCYAPLIVTMYRVGGQEVEVRRKCSGHHQARRKGVKTWHCMLCGQDHVPKKKRMKQREEKT